MGKNPQFKELEHKAEVARGHVLAAYPLEPDELRLFNRFYKIKMDGALSKYNLKKQTEVFPLHQAMGNMEHSFNLDLAELAPAKRARVQSAINAWVSEVNPSLWDMVDKGVYDPKDKNYSVGGGYQMDGIAGAVVGGAGGIIIADKLGLSWIWKAVLGFASAVVGSLLANRATDHVLGKTAPEKEEVPEGTLPAPKATQIHPKQEQQTQGNIYAPPSVHSPSFNQHTGQIDTATPNQNFNKVPFVHTPAYDNNGNIHTDVENTNVNRPPFIPNATQVGEPHPLGGRYEVTEANAFQLSDYMQPNIPSNLFNNPPAAGPGAPPVNGGAGYSPRQLPLVPSSPSTTGRNSR